MRTPSSLIFACALYAGIALSSFGALAPVPDGAPLPPSDTEAEISKEMGLDVKAGDLLAMERFLSMPPEKIREVIRALEKIAALSNAERKQLVQKVKDFRMMNDEKRRVLFYELTHTSPRERDMVRRYFETLSEEARKQAHCARSEMKGSERIALHRQWVEKANAAGIEPNMRLSDIPGDDMPRNLKRGGRLLPPEDGPMKPMPLDAPLPAK